MIQGYPTDGWFPSEQDMFHDEVPQVKVVQSIWNRLSSIPKSVQRVKTIPELYQTRVLLEGYGRV
jgi:hypothetical protein